MAGVKFDAHYNITSVDPPELVWFIKKNYPDVHLDFPRDKDGNRISMWNLIPKKTLPPTRMVRYCCEKLKEASGKGRIVITGVRWAESPRRKNTHGVVDLKTTSKKIINRALEENESASLNSKGGLIMNDDNDESRRMVEQCYRTKKTMLNPIVDWTDDEVWEFLNDVVKVPHCYLYDEGFSRLGCIGCPMQGRKGMERDFKRWPKYRDAYLRAFERLIENHGDNSSVIRRLSEEHQGMFDIDLGLRERERESRAGVAMPSCGASDALVDDSGRREIAEALMQWWLN